MSVNNSPRREFLKTSVKGSVIAGIGLSSLGSFIESCSPVKKTMITSPFKTGFDQQPLPYAYDALENSIDAKTMEIHFTKHAAAYSKNLKEAAQAENASTKSVEEILMHVSRYSAKMHNNSGGHYNHEMFWQSMRPKQADNKPGASFMAILEKHFTSFANFKTQFSDAGKNRFGSGWAWLYLDKNKNLKIGSTSNQDNPLMDTSEINGLPVLGLDVWEHAYYLKYQNKRADYIDNWWSVVNWDYVWEHYKKMS
ncbi:MAG: superoxide dismutase [Chitinophagaceae bacterium]|nr:superoxide dismutase [Chitinophagaceae bacterium]